MSDIAAKSRVKLFAIGQIVYLNSGSPPLMVYDADHHGYWVEWNGGSSSCRLPAACLTSSGIVHHASLLID